MPVPQKLPCVVERIAAHGERVYTVTLRPEGQAPAFRPGQALHLALDPYDPTMFWPDSRVFSIASSPGERRALRITYAVHGRFTARMEGELTEGRQVWIKMPYGDFVVDDSAEVALFAGGTGITAFTAFLGGLSGSEDQPITLAYGARTSRLLIYRELVDHCAHRVANLDVSYFAEAADEGEPPVIRGKVSVEAVLPRIHRPLDAQYYLSGPPAMLRSIGGDLCAHRISPEAIHIDAWE
jgi:ferredoxin-NADP reductase